MKRNIILVGIIVGIILVIGLSVMIINNSKSEPKEEQIKAICELSTLKCYFNNVAKSTKDKGAGITHLFEKERDYWIEYEGIAKIGIDMNKVTMKVKKGVIKISMPSAEVQELNINKDTLNEDSYVMSKDGFFNKNKITVEEQQAAIIDAQKKLEETINENKYFFERAEEVAKELIENYIQKIGEISGKKYSIEWEKI